MEARPISRRPHAALRGRMAERDVTGKYLAHLWHCSEQCISARMTGRQPWTVHEIYTLMDLLGIDPAQMAQYFPDYRRRPPKRQAVKERGGAPRKKLT